MLSFVRESTPPCKAGIGYIGSGNGQEEKMRLSLVFFHDCIGSFANIVLFI